MTVNGRTVWVDSMFSLGRTVAAWFGIICPDTLAASHLNRAVIGPSSVANDAEGRKVAKYSSLSPQYTFIPIAVETLGALGDEALSFFRDLGHRIATVTAEPRSFQFLLQRLCDPIRQCSLCRWHCADFCLLGWCLLFVTVFSHNDILMLKKNYSL